MNIFTELLSISQLYTCDPGHPVVLFVSGLEMVVVPEKFVVKMGGGAMAVRRQLPLRLAWAISVHKSQARYILLYNYVKA